MPLPKKGKALFALFRLTASYAGQRNSQAFLAVALSGWCRIAKKEFQGNSFFLLFRLTASYAGWV
jgi:hypothetical protein